jgi:chromatin segregation and condensation protein Rec8/ScpA/Scc1 (kleisin family)
LNSASPADRGADDVCEDFQDRTDRIVMIGLFLAILELIRDQLISFEQTENIEFI